MMRIEFSEMRMKECCVQRKKMVRTEFSNIRIHILMLRASYAL